jgi:hypothetical protein
VILPHHILLYPRLVPPALLSNPPTCAPIQVATNWKEEGRNETSPENDYTNNEASVPIEIFGMSVRALPDSEVWRHVERVPPWWRHSSLGCGHLCGAHSQ